MPALQTEIDELEALCKLYMVSNPNFNNKTPSLSQADLSKAVTNSLLLVGQVASLSSLIAEDASFVECSDAERAGLASLFAVFNNMQQGAAEGSKTFAKGGLASKDFASTFTKLAQANNEQVSQDGVSFADLNSFVSKCFSDNAQIVQRIADKELNAKRQQQAAAEEAARQENEARKAAAAAARAEAERAAAEQR